MYGQFSPYAIVDGRNRIIPFQLNSDNGQVTALIPHFWEELGNFFSFAKYTLSPFFMLFFFSLLSKKWLLTLLIRPRSNLQCAGWQIQG